MNVILNILIVTLEEGLMYALMALGVYITYSILDFPDLSVDGTFPLGAILSGILIMKGVNPWLCLLIAFAVGMLAGTVTGLLHVKLKIRPLLCGILIYTGCLSINLVMLLKGTGGKAIATFFNKDTIFNSSLGALIPESIGGYYLRTTIVSLILVVVCKVILDLYLKTKSGLLLRATGDNENVRDYARSGQRRFKDSRTCDRKRLCGACRLGSCTVKGLCRPADGRGNGGSCACFRYNRSQRIQKGFVYESDYDGNSRLDTLQGLLVGCACARSADGISEASYGVDFHRCARIQQRLRFKGKEDVRCFS